MPPDFTRALLDTRPVLLLLDGLDEIRDTALRASVSRQISNFMKNRASLYAAVTCRFAGYTARSRLDSDFMELHLRPLTKEQAQTFVRTWYGLVEGEGNRDPAQARAIAAKKSGELTTILESPEFRARRVFEMTRNPLLLTNLCLVHWDQGKLPNTRGKLYKESIDVLLEFWRGARGMEIRIEADKGRRILQPAAFWLHQERERTRASARELEKILDPELERVKWPLGTARHFGDSWWQEVILLLLGLEEPSRFKPFMEEVVKRPAFAEYPEMAALCLDDAAEIDWEPFLNLVKEPAGDREDKWRRQLAALRILERQAPERLAPLSDDLSGHPMKEIAERFRAKADVLSPEVRIHGDTRYEMVRIPAGHFIMGSPEDEKGRLKREGPAHRVDLQEFYMGRYPVTNRQYGVYMRSNPGVKEPEYWASQKFNGPDQPVVGVSWEEARAFARWAGLGLPSESQWEYACRAGTQTRYYTGDDESDLAQAGWYGGNSDDRLHPVGEKPPNDFGLYDMHGNVWEWIEDHWHGDYSGAPDDGSAWIDPDEGSYRVVRGGSFSYEAGRCHSAYRHLDHPSFRYPGLGFRLVLLPGRQA